MHVQHCPLFGWKKLLTSTRYTLYFLWFLNHTRTRAHTTHTHTHTHSRPMMPIFLMEEIVSFHLIYLTLLYFWLVKQIVSVFGPSAGSPSVILCDNLRAKFWLPLLPWSLDLTVGVSIRTRSGVFSCDLPGFNCYFVFLCVSFYM